MKKFILLAGTLSLLVISCRQEEMITAEDSATLKIVQNASVARGKNNTLPKTPIKDSVKTGLKSDPTFLNLADPGETVPPPRR